MILRKVGRGAMNVEEQAVALRVGHKRTEETGYRGRKEESRGGDSKQAFICITYH